MKINLKQVIKKQVNINLKQTTTMKLTINTTLGDLKLDTDGQLINITLVHNDSFVSTSLSEWADETIATPLDLLRESLSIIHSKDFDIIKSFLLSEDEIDLECFLRELENRYEIANEEFQLAMESYTTYN